MTDAMLEDVVALMEVVLVDVVKIDDPNVEVD